MTDPANRISYNDTAGLDEAVKPSVWQSSMTPPASFESALTVAGVNIDDLRSR